MLFKVILCCCLLIILSANCYLSRCDHTLRAISGRTSHSQFLRAPLPCFRIRSVEPTFFQSPGLHGQRVCSGPTGECAWTAWGDAMPGDRNKENAGLSAELAFQGGWGGFLFIKFHLGVSNCLYST